MLRNPRGRVCTLYNVDTAINTESRYRYREYFYWINIQAVSRRSSPVALNTQLPHRIVWG